MVPPEVENDIQSNGVEAEIKPEVTDIKEIPNHTFRPLPDTKSNYNFEDEVQWLPFEFNIGDVHLNKEQWDWHLNLIYDKEEAFSTHNEVFGLWNKLTHTIPTTTEKNVYLPHRTIPWQLQGEVRKCLNTWLRQGIICPS